LGIGRTSFPDLWLANQRSDPRPTPCATASVGLRCGITAALQPGIRADVAQTQVVYTPRTLRLEG